jgi:hypothetical protein
MITLNTGMFSRIPMTSALVTLILVMFASSGVGQSPSLKTDPVLAQEKAIAAQVEGRAHIRGFKLKTKVPEIRIDAGPTLSSYGSVKDNVVHEEYWEKVPAPEQASFNQWATNTTDEPTGRALFEDMFYRFFFVHELGHWMQIQVLDQRHDPMAARARKNSDTDRWQLETVANRISVAWWREHESAYLAKLVKDFRAIEAKLPNPIPPGEAPKHFFTREYDRISTDPDIYGWFPLQMVILVYDEQPALSFQQAIDKLPTENYGD